MVEGLKGSGTIVPSSSLFGELVSEPVAVQASRRWHVEFELTLTDNEGNLRPCSSEYNQKDLRLRLLTIVSEGAHSIILCHDLISATSQRSRVLGRAAKQCSPWPSNSERRCIRCQDGVLAHLPLRTEVEQCRGRRHLSCSTPIGVNVTYVVPQYITPRSGRKHTLAYKKMVDSHRVCISDVQQAQQELGIMVLSLSFFRRLHNDAATKCQPLKDPRSSSRRPDIVLPWYVRTTKYLQQPMLQARRPLPSPLQTVMLAPSQAPRENPHYRYTTHE